MTFTKQKAKVKQILTEMNPNEIIGLDHKYYEFIYNFFQLHPQAEHKFSKGCMGFSKIHQKQWGDNYSFGIVDNELKNITISSSFGLNDKNKTEVLRALRSCIYPEIRNKKSNFIAGVTRCEIDNRIIYEYEDLHIDHHDLEFKDIVSEFFKDKGVNIEKVKVEVIDTVRYLIDKKLEKDFIYFHNNNTHLRFTYITNNLKK